MASREPTARASAKATVLPESSNDYYKLYIKNLEGHYLSLFKSPDYVKAMGATLDALEEFVEARNAVAQDMLKAVSMPTQNDLDELYKEMYQLKKRVKILEKENHALRSGK